MIKKKFILVLNLISFFSVSLYSCSNEEDLGERVEERTLNFYALNDFHGAFLYDKSEKQTGLSRIAKFLIDEKSKDPENTFIISSGDMFQGGAESNITRGKIMVEAMNTIGFDSMTIGNHEFDWGEETLKNLENEMDFPLLGINVFYEDDSGENSLTRPEYLAPSTIIKKEGIKVGIIGSIMPNIDSSILATISDDFYFESSISLIEEEADRLKNKENCDIVVLSAHDGGRIYYQGIENIDAVFLGHEHEKMEGKYRDGVPYVQGVNYGKYLSHISLDLKLENNHYKVVSSNVENIDTFSTFLENSSQIDDIYSKYKDEIEPIRDEVLYTFDERISKSEFGKYIAKSLYEYVNSNYEYKVSLGCINNNGGVRDDIESGEFTYGDLLKVYPFENILCLLEINPKDYKSSYFSQSGLYKYFEDESGNPLINENGKAYIATADFVAYRDNSPKERIIEYQDVLLRDVVANNLKTNGFSL